MQTYNVNNRVTVELTDVGLKRWTEYWEPYGGPIGLTGRVLETQVWQLMNVFGDMMYNGSMELPFVNNKITIHES